MLTTSYLNLIDPSIRHARPNPHFGQVEYRGNRNNSSYQALVAMLQRTFTRGLLDLGKLHLLAPDRSGRGGWRRC